MPRPGPTDEAVPISTRSRILEAGVRLWSEQSPTMLFSGLSVARVASTAKVTRSTFYSYWPTSEEYVSDLLSHLLELDATDYPSIVRERFPDATSGSKESDMQNAVIADCTDHFMAAVEDPTIGLRLGFLAKADDPSVAASLRALYRRSEDLQYAPFEVSLSTWSRHLRAPFTERDMKLIFSTLLEGLAIRFRLDPTSFSPELYGRTILPLLITLTRRPEDERDINEITDSLNSWPAVGLTTKLRERERDQAGQTPSIAKGSIREVTTAIRRLLARVGFGELSMAEIAIVTGYSESTLQQMFGSRPGIALCQLFLNSFERYLTVDEELRGIDRVRALVAINADELRRNPAIAQNMLLLLSGHTALPRTDLIDFDPRPIFDDAVRQAVELGHLDGGLDPAQLSEVLQRSIVLDGSSLGVGTPDVSSVELILRGAGAPDPHAGTVHTQ